MPRNTLEILGMSAVGKGKDIVDCLIEIDLNHDKYQEAFLVIKETLSRVGVKTKMTENVLYQTCHILHSQGRYYIVHFKHLFMLDGRINGLSREDIQRMNRIALLLQQWGLCTVKNPEQITELAETSHIKVVSHEDVKDWQLKPKYFMRKSTNKRNHNS